MSEIIKKRLAVVGSRDFNDKGKLYDVLTKNFDRIKLIISGGARGADSLAVEWATDYGIPYLVFPALWRDPFTGIQNKGAGFKRNVLIVEQAEVVMAFWDGKSAGTAHTIEMAKQRGKPVRIISFAPPKPPTVPPMFGVKGISKVAVESEIPPQGCEPHCCTAEAMQAQHDFYEAQELSFKEASAPQQASEVHEAIAEPPPDDDNEATL